MNINFRKKQIWKACRVAGMYKWQCDNVAKVEGNVIKAFPFFYPAFALSCVGRHIEKPMKVSFFD